MRLRKRRLPRAFVPTSVDVRSMRMQCEVCGTPIDVLETVRDAETDTQTNALYRPCGHSAIPDFRGEPSHE